MNRQRLRAITAKYPKRSIAVVGDFCLDRYLEIDPGRQETSLETSLSVHNVVNVRSQPGAAGTILNNLVALGIGSIHPVGFCGMDGEGYELQRALRAEGSAVQLGHFFPSDGRRTFTYCKPLLLHPGKPPEELNRLDTKNWTPTPLALQDRLAAAVTELASKVDAIILMDQVDVPETGVITQPVLDAVAALNKARPLFLVIADSRRGLKGYPPVIFKMNAAELAALTGASGKLSLAEIKEAAVALARKQGHRVFVTMSENGILGAGPRGDVEHVPTLPVRGEIDIVGAGDAVTANLTAAMAAGANLRESIEIANAAASIVIHQLGTTGTATVKQIEQCLFEAGQFQNS